MQGSHLTAQNSDTAIKKAATLGHRKGMAIASLNVNSLLLDIDEIRMLVNELGIRVLAINETKLDNSIDHCLVNIEGYTIKFTLLDKSTVR